MKDIKKTISSYDRFVPYQLLNLLNKTDITQIKLGDQVEQNITVLFSDIRDFTTISERLTPQENFNFLNSYLSQMEPLISVNDGIVDKYIGDAIMAIFPVSADNAYNCAMQMLKQLRLYNKGRKRAGYQPIRIGIGLNTGMAMIGTVGGYNRMEATVISDAVNLCSRIESLTKVYGVNLLIGENTYHSLDREHKRYTRFIDRVLVKGKYKPQSVYEVFAGDPEDMIRQKTESKPLFEEALANFHYQHVQNAKALLEKCLSTTPGDIPARIYLERCNSVLATGEWQGDNHFLDRISWGKKFIINHETIDRQHRELVNASIALIEDIERDLDGPTLENRIMDIDKLARHHFRTEEAVFKNTAYPLSAYHEQEHAKFLSSFSAIRSELANDSVSKLFRMFKVQVFLIDWLVSHTLKEDRNYRKYLTDLG